MRRLYRRRAKKPPEWDAVVEAKIPLRFWHQARVFEARQLKTRAQLHGPHGHTLGWRVAEWNPLWKDPNLRTALQQMSRFCAYCESEIIACGAATVDHFKPKSLFPTLAYEWTNYFLACFACNGKKGNRWRPDYIRPDRGLPSRHFVFSKNGSIRAAAKDRAASAVIADFGLDRHGLQECRRLAIEFTKAIVDLYPRRSKARVAVLKRFEQSAYGTAVASVLKVPQKGARRS